MNIEELVRIHENVYKWLVPHSLPTLFGTLLKSDDLKQWAKDKFRAYYDYESPIPGMLLASVTLDNEFWGARLDPETHKILEMRLRDPEIWRISSTFVLYTHTDLSVFRKMEYDADAVNFERSADTFKVDDTKRLKENLYPILLSMLNIPPELEKRDEALCGIFGSLYDLITSRTQDACREVAAIDTVQFLRQLPELAELDMEKRRAYGWACVIDKDNIKAALSPLFVSGVVTSDFGPVIAERLQQIMRDSTAKDRSVSKYGEENRTLSAEAEKLRKSNSALASERDSLSAKVRALEARPQTVVPVDAAKLQKELEAAREYENLFNLSDAENKGLRDQIMSLQGQLEGITAQAHQRHEQENGVYESFAMYAVREGYDADLAAAIIRANSKFRSNNMVPRSMMRKNAQNALEDKSKIKDFEKTLKWLIGMNVYNQKGDAFSTTINFSEIPTSDVRMYVSMLVDREA